MLSMYSVLQRIEEGVFMEEREFDMRIYSTVKRLVKEFDIVFDRDYIVSVDSSLAKSVFEAGFQLALDVGMYVVDARRVVKFSEEELKYAIKSSPKEIIVGEGRDSRILYARKIEDQRKPIIMGGQSGAPIPEEFYYEMALSYAIESYVDILSVGGLAKIRGIDVRTRSPAEVLATFLELSYLRMAIQAAGRPGMPIKAGESSVSALGDLAILGMLRKTDAHLVALLNDLKTDYDRLAKAFAFKQYGGINIALIDPVIGGFLGGPEGVVVGLVASNILSKIIYMADFIINHPIHPKYVSTTTPETMWVLSTIGQTMAHNTDFIVVGDVWTSNGAGSYTIFHEMVPVTISNTVSGLHLCGVVATNGKYPNASGLEARFMAQIAYAATRFSRGDANEIVKVFLKKYYPHSMEKPDIGKPFPELYNMKTIEPQKWWLELYKKAVKEVEDHGIKIETFE
ncbi:MAG: monomethylamine:corrinoid methyltransferase [Ignisphaera sp.]